jgi:hypothetical protein
VEGDGVSSVGLEEIGRFGSGLGVSTRILGEPICALIGWGFGGRVVSRGLWAGSVGGDSCVLIGC